MLEGIFGILAFFGSVFGLIAGIIVLAIALVNHHLGRAWKIGRILLAWIGVYAVVLLVVSFTSQARSIPPGEERCFDEMCYSVKAVSIAHTLSAVPNPITAQGNYFIVTIQLRSAAKRAAQKPSEPDLFIVDANGQGYSQAINAGSEINLPIGQPVTARQLWDQAVQPGETVSRTVAFDLPAGIRQPGFAFIEGVGAMSGVIIGDENSFFHAKTEFRLIFEPLVPKDSTDS